MQIRRLLLMPAAAMLCGILSPCANAEGRTDLLPLRQAYNAAAARIDSLVRQMHRRDQEAVDASLLPKPSEPQVIPEGMKAIAVFWADDEARVWLNDFPVGQTRLTPVEVEIPRIYFRNQNELRVHCWDTDGVESGLLLTLYLEDTAGARYPIVASSEDWLTADGPAFEITYAHPMPDIPGAAVIWGHHTLGRVEFRTTFSREDVQSAWQRREVGPGVARRPTEKMEYHRFLQELAALQTEKESIGKKLSSASEAPVDALSLTGGHSPGLTLGKAGPLREHTAAPLAEDVLTWARDLESENRKLVLPDARALKGESSATASGDETASGEAGDRRRDYRPPDDGTATEGGRKGDGSAEASAGQKGEGLEGSASGASAGRSSGSAGRLRLGLLIPTVVLGAYVTYLARQFRD